MITERLRCEHLVDPLGIDAAVPRLSWWATSGRRGDRQVAYQVEVASNLAGLLADHADIWDSGRVESDRCTLVAYAGPALPSRAERHWRVRAWDCDGQASPWSAPARWEMGLLEPPDWTGRWIHHRRREAGNEGRPSRLRRTFTLEGEVARGRLYASALGAYTATLNGAEVGDWVLRPGWTDYNVRTQYQVHDVTSLLRPGPNVIGALLADAWYSGRTAWLGRNVYGPHPSFLAQLEVTLTDGRTVVVGTDESWTAAWASMTAADILDGERHDRRRDDDAFSSSAPVRGWRRAALTPAVTTQLVAQVAQPLRRTRELVPASIERRPRGALVVDLGQNMAGWLHLVARGRRGARVTVRHAEMLDTQRRLYTANLRGAPATDRYVLAGRPGSEVLEPRFTYHGFRYAEVTADGAAIDAPSIRGVAVHNDLPVTGGFRCSNELLNQLQSNVEWSQRSNFFEVPTDCPQRDERLGWLGDAQVFAPTACFLVDSAAFFTKWMQDVVDGQSAAGGFADVAPRMRSILSLAGPVPWPDAAPGWGDAGVIVPWAVHRAYGDTEIIDRHFDAMDRWIRCVDGANPDHRWRHRRGNDYGDWLSIGESTDKELLATAYFAHSTDLLARMAALTGRDRRAAELADLHSAIAAGFREDHLHADGTIGDDTQTAYVLALRFGLLTPAARPAAVEHLVRRIAAAGWHLRTGFLGVSHLLTVLADHGRIDVAYRLLTNDTFPSWGYSIRQGATTIWERWDGWTETDGFQAPAMNSFNHYALGSVGAWMYANVGGIALDDEVPAYRRARMAPRPGGGLTDAAAWLDSVHGRFECSWAIDSRGVLRLDVTVPANADARVALPTARPGTVSEGGVSLADAAGVTVCDAGSAGLPVTCAVVAGRYSFVIPDPEVVPSLDAG